MMGLIQGNPTKRDAELAAEATRESWQAILDRLAMLVQAKSLPERQSVRNDVLGAIHVHMARRSYENRVNWQIERDEIFKAIQDAGDPATIVERLRAMLAKPETPSAPIPPLSPTPTPEPEKAKPAPKPMVSGVVHGESTSIQIESRQPEYATHRVSGKWRGDIQEAQALIEADARKEYPFGYRELKIDPAGTFSYIGHTD